MAKQKTKAGAEKKSKSRLWLPIGIVAGLLVAGGGLWFVGLGLLRAHSKVVSAVGNLEENRFANAKITVTPAPDWIEPNLVSNLLAQFEAQTAGRTLLDGDLVGLLAGTFSENAWVESVRVRKRFRAVDVEVSYRKPVLSVPYGPYNCYVDAHGVALPPPAPSEPPSQFRHCLWVEHFPQTAIPSVGQRFEDENLLTIAKLADLLLPYKSDLGVVAIVATTSPDGKLACNLRTRLGSRIVLGRVADMQLDEQSLRETFAPLRSWLERYGSLDAPEGPYQFDLSGDAFLEPVPLVALRR